MSSDSVEQIKSRLNIMDVVENYVKLTKAGKNFKALSPFTSERTPSFFVSPDQGLYYCFSSGKGGDMFTFVQEMEGVDFAGALKILAARAGVELKPENPKTRDEKEKLFIALEAATRYYESELRKQPKVIEYLKKRGITGVSAKNFRIGYAPEGWRGLYDHLSARGFDSNIIEKAGLAVRSEKGYYDRFRGRIMFPIFNSSGAVVAFSGRIFHVSKEPEDKAAKYVNSPETPLYNKSEILYGFDKAKQAIRNKNSCIFVEGQVDLVLAHQAGTQNTVAVSGTALSKQHLILVRRLAEDLVFAFDADDAGVNAAERGVGLALSEGFEVKIVNIPKGKDPADIILEDPDKWKELIEKAKPVIDFYLDYITRENKDDRSRLKGVREIILPLVKCLNKTMELGRYVSKIADKLQVAEKTVWDDLEKVPARIQQKEIEQKEVKWKDPSSRKEKIKEKILGIFLWQSGIKDPKVDLDEIKKEYEKTTEDTNFLNNNVPSEEKGRLIFEAEVCCGQEQPVQEQINDLFLNLKKEILKERSAKLYQQIKQAEESGDKKKEEELLSQRLELKRKMEELFNSTENED